MQNDYDFTIDLSHISKQIQKNTADINAAREQAKNQRLTANQKYRDGDPNGARYYEQEAARFEKQAGEHERDTDQLLNRKKNMEVRIAELEKERAGMSGSNATRLTEINRELVRLRGSGMML